MQNVCVCVCVCMCVVTVVVVVGTENKCAASMSFPYVMLKC